MGKPFYEGLIKYITSGPVVAMVLEGTDAIAAARATMGATNPTKAAAGTIRAGPGPRDGAQPRPRLGRAGDRSHARSRLVRGWRTGRYTRAIDPWIFE